jgi:UDP-N-acetylglucosamine 1-carboxyvinyltransferase
MDKMRIRGGRVLNGTVQASGAKNSALPILFSSLLSGEACHYRRVPNLQDIRTTLKLLEQLGAEVKDGLTENRVTVQAQKLDTLEATYDLVRTMRASVVVLGPMLALGRRN